jgi:hypothetical protein
MDALTGLLEERRRYEGWLAQLDARRGEVPPHVIERVRLDYDQRLRGVTEQLRSRASDLEESARSLDERARALLAEETERRDERAEAELRAMVGEYPPDRAQELLARCDETIGRLSSERGAVSAELERVQDILSQVRRPGIETPLRADGPAAVEPAAPAVPPAPAPPLAPPAGADAAAAFDELAFLNSVVQPRPMAVPGIADFAPAPNAAPRRAAAGAPDPLGHESAATRAAAVTPEGGPAFLRETPTEQVKTLKCQECGTMNYPTEWYCERCGGELAAL